MVKKTWLQVRGSAVWIEAGAAPKEKHGPPDLLMA